jgi:hypothetical protein
VDRDGVKAKDMITTPGGTASLHAQRVVAAVTGIGMELYSAVFAWLKVVIGCLRTVEKA